MTENEKDIQLLKEDAGKLVLKYHGVVGLIVRRYRPSGMRWDTEVDEEIQAITVALLEKMPRIREQYDGSTLLKTYMWNIIRNLCIDRYHKRKHSPQHLDLGDVALAEPNGTASRLFVEDEIRLLGTILAQFHSARPKLLICLKLFFRMPIASRDIYDWYPQCDKKGHELLLSLFGSDYDNLETREVFRVLAGVMNKAEGKNNLPQAYAKWTRVRVREIVDLLNGDPPISAHNLKTLKILFAEYDRSFSQS